MCRAVTFANCRGDLLDLVSAAMQTLFSASPRSTLMMVFAAFGSAIGSLAGSMPSIMANAGIDSETLGFGLMLSTAATVLAMSAGGAVARHASGRMVLLVVLPAFALLLSVYLTAQSVGWFYCGVITMGFAFGLTDLFMNAEAVALEHDLRRPVFTAFHGAVSVGVAGMAIVSSFVSTLVGTWATAMLASLLMALAWMMVRSNVKARPLASGQGARLAGLPHKPALMALGIAAGLIIAAETAALLWSAKLLNELAPSLAAIAGLGAAFFGICNATLRFPGDRLRSWFGDMPLMMGSLLVAIAGFSALGVAQSFGWSVAAFAAVGFGTAVLIPCIFAVAAKLAPGNRAGALSFLSMLTALPRVLAPYVFGVVATGLGMNAAFGLVAVGLAAAMVLTLASGAGRKVT